MKDSTTVFEAGEPGDISTKKIAVAVSAYHESITSRLLDAALQTIAAAGIPDGQVAVAWVPGAWELAVAAKRLIADCDAVVCLGAVIAGETTHDQYINSMLAITLGQLSVETGKPVAFGVLTCQTVDQAVQRSGGTVGNKGAEAASAAIQMLRLFDKLIV